MTDQKWSRKMFNYNEDWVTFTLHPDYEISSWGRIRHKETEEYLTPYYSHRYRSWVYDIEGNSYKANLLLYRHFPTVRISIGKEWKQKLDELDEAFETPKPTRRCHDCGKPTFNYRCEECWRKLRSENTDYLFDPDIDRF